VGLTVVREVEWCVVSRPNIAWSSLVCCCRGLRVEYLVKILQHGNLVMVQRLFRRGYSNFRFGPPALRARVSWESNKWASPCVIYFFFLVMFEALLKRACKLCTQRFYLVNTSCDGNNIVSRVLVTIEGVWIGEWIY
jgi:hypothetical protein